MLRTMRKPTDFAGAGGAAAASLFAPLTVRGVTFRNRIAVSPMCQYSAWDGFAGEWHLVHAGSRAVGGAGLVLLEATAVEERGRISPGDLGIWKDEQIAPLAGIAEFVKQQGAAAGIQIAHAGAKASTAAPWQGGGLLSGQDGGWLPVAPSALDIAGRGCLPRELTLEELSGVAESFKAAALRAFQAGFQVLEIHAAHG